MSVAIDRHGAVYVAETWNYRVQKFTADGAFLTKWGTHGAGPGQFDGNEGVTVDANDNIYVSDNNNERVEKFRAPLTAMPATGPVGAGLLAAALGSSAALRLRRRS
jgi:sugar lactone lactonase YvrE